MLGELSLFEASAEILVKPIRNSRLKEVGQQHGTFLVRGMKWMGWYPFSTVGAC